MLKLGLGYWVITTSSPWMAAKNSFYGQPSAFKESVLLKCFQAILRTGGGIAATGRGEWRNKVLVKLDQKNKRGN